MQTFYNTLDLDRIDIHAACRIVEKILRKECCLKLEFKPSTLKGFHIIMRCSKECDDCRFVFDDAHRYEIDFRRTPSLTNVLFDTVLINGARF